MAVLCNECELIGKKPKKIWCKLMDVPCMHVRYCAVSMKYYQTDDALRCKAREKYGKAEK